MPKHSNITQDLFTDYIRSNTSARISERLGVVLIRYMTYVIDAIIHGYTIRMGNVIKFSFAKIPVSEYSASKRIHYFQSNLTSDWLFFIDIECRIMEKNHVMFIPSRRIKRQIQSFIDSEKVYELIR